MKNITCSFAGYRPQKLSILYDELSSPCVLLKRRLKSEIERMIENNNVATFISGMAMGIDLIAAEIVLIVKKERPYDDIRLVTAIPFEGQDDSWCGEYRKRYRHVLDMADEQVIISEYYTRACMYERNRYMVDNSDYIIAVFDGKSGGTKYTLDYAIKRGVGSVVIDPRDFLFFDRLVV
ncbi:MAG: SLOG family protein [Clostridia bacterium]